MTTPTVLRARPPHFLSLSLVGCLSLACESGEETTNPDAATQRTAAVQPAPAPEPGPEIPQVSDDPIVQKIVELGITDSQVDAHLNYLVENIGPRLTSSHNLMRAERWARDQFASWGLESKLEQWGSFPVGFDRGPWSGKVVDPETKLDFTTRAWTPGVFGPHRAPAQLYPTSAKAVKKMKDLEGAWIVRVRDPEGQGPSEKEQDKIDAALAEAKVAGIINKDRDRAGELVHTGGRYKVDWADLPEVAQVILRGDQHDGIAKRLSDGEPVELEFSIDNRFFKGPVPQNNVIAEIRGSEKPDEVVVVGGHIDSWDGATGAVDNGTGCATTMEAARLLMAAGAKPKRTIRFMLWGGEEQGLLGSRAYVEAHKDEMDKVSGVFVHDGGTNYLGGIAVTPEMLSMAKQIFEPITKLSAEHPFYIVLTDALSTGGSDHTPFINAGAPGFFWIQEGRADYNHAHHTQYDTLDAAIPEYQRHSAMVAAIAAYNLANADGMLNRENSSPLPRRSLDVEFDGRKISKVEKGVGKSGGLKKGDEIVGLKGVDTSGSRWRMWMAMQRGEPKKTVLVKRGGKQVELELDWSETEGEKLRAERAASRKKAFGELVYGEPVFGAKPPDEKPAEKPAAAKDKPDGDRADAKTDEKPAKAASSQ
jgi:hypothetical protein